MKKLCLNLSLLGALFALSLEAASPHFWSERIPKIETKLKEALSQSEKADIKAAKKACDDAYFGLFEEHAANMEIAIRNRSAELSNDLEGRFGEIRKKISQKQDHAEIQKEVESLVKDLNLAAKNLDKDGVSPP